MGENNKVVRIPISYHQRIKNQKIGFIPCEIMVLSS